MTGESYFPLYQSVQAHGLFTELKSLCMYVGLNCEWFAHGLTHSVRCVNMDGVCVCQHCLQISFIWYEIPSVEMWLEYCHIVMWRRQDLGVLFLPTEKL